MNLLTKLGLFLAEEGGDLSDLKEAEDAEGFLKVLEDFVFGETTMAIIGVALTLFLVIKGVMVGMKIVKAADDTSERKQAIDSLKYMIIGVVIVAVLYYGAGAIVGLFF